MAIGDLPCHMIVFDQSESTLQFLQVFWKIGIISNGGILVGQEYFHLLQRQGLIRYVGQHTPFPAMILRGALVRICHVLSPVLLTVFGPT